MTENTVTRRERPLSPHLQVYRLPMTAVMSILHRITGFALCVGLLMFIWLLLAAAAGPEAYGVFTTFAGSWFGLVLIAGWIAAFWYHLFNGIRHLLWDIGYLFELKNAFRAGIWIWLATIVLTVATWWAFCPWMGE